MGTMAMAKQKAAKHKLQRARERERDAWLGVLRVSHVVLLGTLSKEGDITQNSNNNNSSG